MKPKLADIIYFTALAAFDAFVYITLVLLLMDYDGKQDNSKAVYGNFQIMPGFDKMINVVFILWNLLNLFFIIYFSSRFIKYIKKQRSGTVEE